MCFEEKNDVSAGETGTIEKRQTENRSPLHRAQANLSEASWPISADECTASLSKRSGLSLRHFWTRIARLSVLGDRLRVCGCKCVLSGCWVRITILKASKLHLPRYLCKVNGRTRKTKASFKFNARRARFNFCAAPINNGRRHDTRAHVALAGKSSAVPRPYAFFFFGRLVEPSVIQNTLRHC